jgi:YesN/AraC family two-component response regulator
MVPDYLPHIVVTDVTMPQLSGIELAMRLNKLCP